MMKYNETELGEIMDHMLKLFSILSSKNDTVIRFKVGKFYLNFDCGVIDDGTK